MYILIAVLALLLPVPGRMATVIQRDSVTGDELNGLIPTSHPESALAQLDGGTVVVFTAFQPGNTAIYQRVLDSASANWSEPRRLSASDRKGDRFPSLWQDGKKTLHCVWLSRVRKQDYEVLYSRLEKDSPDWSSPVALQAGKENSPPNILGDRRGNLFVWFENRSDQRPAGRIFVYRSKNGGQEWALSDPNFPADEKKGKSLAPKLIVGAEGEVYMAWLDQAPGGLAVVFNRSLDAGESWLPRPLTVNQDRSLALENPQLFLTGEVIHVAWSLIYLTDPGKSIEVWIDSSYDQGKSWTANRKVYRSRGSNISLSTYGDEETGGLMWGERDEERESKVMHARVWEKGKPISADPELVLQAPERTYYDNVQARLERGSVTTAFVYERRVFDQDRITFLVQTRENAWEQMLLNEEKEGLDARLPLSFLVSEDSVYTVAFHEVRRRRFLMEPGIWETNLTFAKLKLNTGLSR